MGNLAVHSTAGPLPGDTEARIARFTELVATAILNAQARDDVRRLAEEQTALRRVATLVAHERPAAEVLATVAALVGRLLPVENTAMLRYEDDGTATFVASWGHLGDVVTVGKVLPVDGENVAAKVRRTGRPARIDDYGAASGALGEQMVEFGIRAAVGCPIVVAGRAWGIMVAAQSRPEPLPVDTESRMAQFTELIATAISNLQARSDLAASRARIVAATDDERRRVVRDLHDGAQQRLVHTVVTLDMADQAMTRGEEGAHALVSEALDNARRATAELREFAHGIMPSVLTNGGLRAGVDSLASRMPVPVENDVCVDRLAPAVEATAYFVISEALTNVAKHARAERVDVGARVEDGMLRVDVARRRRRRCPVRRPGAARARRSARRARRTAHGGQRARSRNPRHGRHPARRDP